MEGEGEAEMFCSVWCGVGVGGSAKIQYST